MRCPSCAADNSEGAHYCSNCGTLLTALTRDRLNSLRAYIPPEVAQKIMSGSRLGERRTVTVLFSDVVGSTALGEVLGPERFKVVMDQVLGRMIAAVSRYEGTVAQVTGDGLLAFFGAPIVHEDDPERAARAALDLRDATSSYAKDLQAAYGVTLQIRVGLNTGPVVVSKITDVLQVAYNALGDTVNTAARLQSIASPGTIVASHTTGRLVAALFDLKPLEPVHLKGKAAPIKAVEILERRPTMGKPRGIAGLVSPLVGRERELSSIQNSLQAVIEGRGQIVSVIGEAGIGKSRLVAEIQRAHSAIPWLEGRCLSYAGGIPYFPFLDILREWLGVGPSDHEARVRIELRSALERLIPSKAGLLYPYLAAMLRLSLEPEAAAQIANLSAESLQHQTFNVMREWLIHLAEQGPLAIIVDDLHWADATSLEMLESLLQVTEDHPVLFCLLLRPDREHRCWELNEIARRRFPHRHLEIAMVPLDSSDTERLVTNLLYLSALPAELLDLISHKAEGNPFFIEEVIRALIEGGILVEEDGRWRSTRQVTTVDIPDSIHAVLLSRIDRLPEAARHTLQTASVIGRLFPLDLLRQVSGENGHLEDVLVDLQRHELIIERRRIPHAEFRFKHALTQEAAYSTLIDEQRHRLHRAVASVLESQHAGQLEEVYAVLAYHYDHAAEEEKALKFLVLAGDKARGEYADQEALQHYSRAVELMKRRGALEGAARTLMKMALAHHIAFDFPAANRAFQEAFDLFEVDQASSPSLGRTPPATLWLELLEPGAIDMARLSDSSSSLAAEQVFEGLIHSAPESSIAPAVARSWEISDDGTRYVFHLRRDHVWSDGRPVTAHDFVLSWLRAMRGTFAQIFHAIRGARSYHEGKTDDPDAVGVRALDDQTLEVILEGPRAYFPFILAHSATLPHPSWLIEQHGEAWTEHRRLTNNGPYQVIEWERGSHLRLVANPRYHGRRRGNVEQIRWTFRPPEAPLGLGQEQPDVQWLFGPREDEVDGVRELLDTGPLLLTMYLFFRCDRPPFNDRRLRLAFAHAFDRQHMHSLGLGIVPAAGGCVPPPIPGHSPQISVPFDPERARALLREAGYSSGQGLGPITIMGPAEEMAPMTRLPLASWKEILGVDVRLAPVPFQSWIAESRDSSNSIGLLGWLPDYPDPDGILRLVFHSTSSANSAHWRSEKFDSLVEEAQASTDQRRRMALYHEADRLLVAEEAAIIPLCYVSDVWVIHPHVKGWWSSSYGPGRIADLVVERED